MNKPPRHHGSVTIGRLLVVGGFLLVAAANAPVFLSAAHRPHPSVWLQLIAAITVVWMLTGSASVCLRNIWGRYFMFIILIAGMTVYSFGGVLIMLENDSDYAGLPIKMFLATLVYVPVLLVLSFSHHVRRLTSRAWD